jgi:hypothetical protein
MTHESATPLVGCDLLATAEGISVYENKNAMPRAFFAHSAVEVKSPAESLAAMRAPGFDPKAQTVVEVDQRTEALWPVEPLPPGPVPQTAGSARIAAEDRNGVLIETDNVQNGLLVLSDNYYPGWSVAVDGAPAQIFRANHTMRGVRVPAGRHLVSFVFMPASFFVSMYVSLAGSAVTLAALILSVFIRKRSSSHDIRQDHKDR